MAATDKFVVKVRGRGGHGGVPDRVQDVVLAASMVVVALQPLISRELSPTDAGVIGITRFNTGTPGLAAGEAAPGVPSLPESLLAPSSISSLHIISIEACGSPSLVHGLDCVAYCICMVWRGPLRSLGLTG